MTAENFSNFATTALNGAISSPSSLSFSVTGGQGALFPSRNFLVTIDSEILQIYSRSGDTFTVGTGGRGYNGSTAATHSNGVTVQLAVCAYNFQHLWQNVADTYVPQVPPQQVGGTASAYDNEFESASGWSLYPGPGGSTVFNAGSALPSHLLLNRVSPDNTTYFAYIAFVPGASPWTATCKLSEGTNLLTINSDQAQTDFFVSDLSNPTTGADTGNRVKLNTVCGNALSGGMLAPSSRIVRTVRDTSGAATFAGTQAPLAAGGSVWLRMSCDGSGTYQTYFSLDGITYWLLAYQAGISFGVASLGLCFHVYNPSAQWVAHQAAVDYVRVVMGSAEPPYGS